MSSEDYWRAVAVLHAARSWLAGGERWIAGNYASIGDNTSPRFWELTEAEPASVRLCAIAAIDLVTHTIVPKVGWAIDFAAGNRAAAALADALSPGWLDGACDACGDTGTPEEHTACARNIIAQRNDEAARYDTVGAALDSAIAGLAARAEVAR